MALYHSPENRQVTRGWGHFLPQGCNLNKNLILPMKFQVNWPFGSGEKVGRKDFQDGNHGGHLGFPIRTILAIFD